MAEPKDMVAFKKIGGSDVLWRYRPKHPYGSGRPGRRKLKRDTLNKLDACFVEMGFLCSMGAPHTIVSAGAYVAGRKSGDPHGKGEAIDIDALHWTFKAGIMESPRILLTNNFPKYPAFYLGVEAQIRRHFGTVLGWLYNSAHRGHWHIQEGTDPGYWEKGFGAETRIKFMKASLQEIWGIDIGERTVAIGPAVTDSLHEGILEIADRLHLDRGVNSDRAWMQYLLATAVKGMSMSIDCLDKSL